MALSRPIVMDPVATNLPGGAYVGLAVGLDVGGNVKWPVGATIVPDSFSDAPGDGDAAAGVHPAADSARSAAAAQATSRDRVFLNCLISSPLLP